MPKQNECVKTLKENEAVWTSRETLMYKRDSRFDYYKDGEKLKSSFIHFNPFKDKIIAVLKEESSIIGYIFNHVQITAEEKEKILRGLRKHVNTKNLEKEFKPVFESNDVSNTIVLDHNSAFVIGTKYEKESTYLNKVFDITMGKDYNPDPLVEFSFIDYVEKKFNAGFKNLFYDRTFHYILLKSSMLDSLEKDIYQILKEAHKAGKDDERLFTYGELLELADYITDRDYYYDEDNFSERGLSLIFLSIFSGENNDSDKSDNKQINKRLIADKFFIYDYITARQEQIKKDNELKFQEYEEQLQEIKNNPYVTPKDRKIQQQELKKEFEENTNTRINELFEDIEDFTPATARRYYYYIKPFIDDCKYKEVITGTSSK